MELRGAEVLGGGRLPGRDITLQETERRKRLSSEGLFLVPLQSCINLPASLASNL